MKKNLGNQGTFRVNKGKLGNQVNQRKLREYMQIYEILVWGPYIEGLEREKQGERQRDREKSGEKVERGERERRQLGQQVE